MPEKPKKKSIPTVNEKFQKAVQILANTPPISNEQLINKSKSRKK